MKTKSEYLLYINDRYFGSYSTIAAARKVALSSTCKYEICKAFPNGISHIMASGWTR